MRPRSFRRGFIMSRLHELCELVSAIEVVRDQDVQSLGFVEIELDGRLVFAENAKNLNIAIKAKGVAAVLTTPELATEVRGSSIGLAVSADPRRSFHALHSALVAQTDFYGKPLPTSINRSAVVHPTAHIDDSCVAVGPDCRIEAGAIVLNGTTLGRGVRVLSGAVLGSEGFQTMKFDGEIRDLPHAGSLVIGDGSVVMANAVVARAVFRQATLVSAGCRIGNGAFVSHNTQIGCRTLIGHGATIAGNTKIGSDAVIGPGAVVLDRLTIGDGAFVTAGAVVTRSVAAGTRVSGNFAMEHRRLVRMLARETRKGS